MQWHHAVRAIARQMRGIPLPDPDRIDIGGVPDTVALLRAIGAAMPRGAVLEMIRPRREALVAFLSACPGVARRNPGEFQLPVEPSTIAELVRAANDCPADEICAHLFVYDGNRTLLEAFDRDKGEDVVWLGCLPKAVRRRFVEALERGAPVAA